MKKIVKKMVSAAGVLMFMAVGVLGVATLRFAIFAPEVLHDVFRTIGG